MSEIDAGDQVTRQSRTGFIVKLEQRPDILELKETKFL
jgi:hypothetical protein